MVGNLQTGPDAKGDPGKEGAGSGFDRSVGGSGRWRPEGLSSRRTLARPQACGISCFFGLEHFLLEGEGKWTSGRVIRPLPRVDNELQRLECMLGVGQTLLSSCLQAGAGAPGTQISGTISHIRELLSDAAAFELRMIPKSPVSTLAH